MDTKYLAWSGRAIGLSAVAATALLSFYFYTQSALTYQNKPRHTRKARNRLEAQDQINSGSRGEELPYPPDILPGRRDVETPYGTIRVYEWGPKDGQKVLLMHGIGTPCIAMGSIGYELVEQGCRVMTFDFFGRGYSDGPSDILYDDRLYTTQLLLVIASSSLPWIPGFHLVGYSLGGALAASFAAYFPHTLKSLALICPGGLIRKHHLNLKSRFLYSSGLLPAMFTHWLIKRRLEPKRGVSADVPGSDEGDVDFDDARLPGGARVGDVMRWQLEGNEGLVEAYISTIQHAPIYDQHGGVWTKLRAVLEVRRGDDTQSQAGLSSGKVMLILADKDPVVVAEEWIEDVNLVLGEDAADVHVIRGGHEIAITRGKEVAGLVMNQVKSSYRT